MKNSNARTRERQTHVRDRTVTREMCRVCRVLHIQKRSRCCTQNTHANDEFAIGAPCNAHEVQLERTTRTIAHTAHSHTRHTNTLTTMTHERHCFNFCWVNVFDNEPQMQIALMHNHTALLRLAASRCGALFWRDHVWRTGAGVYGENAFGGTPNRSEPNR